MRTDYPTPLTEEEARDLLEKIILRAEKINAETREFLNAVAIRADTFISVLRAQPSLVNWVKNIHTLQHRPVYRANDGTQYVVSITRLPMESPVWRAGAMQ